MTLFINIFKHLLTCMTMIIVSVVMVVGMIESAKQLGGNGNVNKKRNQL